MQTNFRIHFKPLELLAKIPRGAIFGVLLLSALVAFEMFNYSTTDYALRDLLGDLSFAGMRWATLLTIAFCGIDFAGVARLFTAQQDGEEHKEVWYLFGAWLLAATMNATLTWWGVSMAIVNHSLKSTAVVDANVLTQIVPVFVALMVWVSRILIIGTLSVAGDRLIWGHAQPVQRRSSSGSLNRGGVTVGRPVVNASPVRPVSTANVTQMGGRPVAGSGRPEPTYHSMTMAPRSTDDSSNLRQQ